MNNSIKLQNNMLPIKALLIGGGIIGCIFVAKRVIKKYQSKKDVKEYEEAIDALPVSESNATITTQQAQLLANQLYSAMESTGTDEDTIIRILSNKNKDDITMIVKAFGIRPYGTYGAPLATWMPSTNLDLMGWLRKELSGKTLQKLEAMFDEMGLFM